VPVQPLFEAYKLLRSIEPKSDRLKQALTLLLWEIEQDGARQIYADPGTGELRLQDALEAPERQPESRGATRVVTFRNVRS